MFSCKICKRSLFGPNERKTGLCDHCRQFNQRCAKCGSILLPGSSERNTGICQKCRITNTKCHTCGKELYSANEKNTGLCDTCRRGAR